MAKLFNPVINYSDLSGIFGYQTITNKITRSTELYNVLQSLTDMAVPTKESDNLKSWQHFYMPITKIEERITVPFRISHDCNTFFINPHTNGLLKVSKGEEEAKDKTDLFKDCIRLAEMMKEQGNDIVIETVPYDIRKGRILGKHVMEQIMPRERKEELLQRYKEHQNKGLKSPDICLEDYLNTAAICYTGAFPKDTDGKTTREMYRMFADIRHGGMLDLDPTSTKAYSEWYDGDERTGSHPFEIVYSSFGHGIMLIPPKDNEDNMFDLRIIDDGLAEEYVKMVETMSGTDVAFKAPSFKHVLDYLSGDLYFYVNTGVFSLKTFQYHPSDENKEKYFRYIEWEDLEFVKWK